MVNLARRTQQNFSSSSSYDLTSSSSSISLEDLLQEFELQIMNQDVVQIQVLFIRDERLFFEQSAELAMRKEELVYIAKEEMEGGNA